MEGLGMERYWIVITSNDGTNLTWYTDSWDCAVCALAKLDNERNHAVTTACIYDTLFDRPMTVH